MHKPTAPIILITFFSHHNLLKLTVTFLHQQQKHLKFYKKVKEKKKKKKRTELHLFMRL